ncbi:alpha/beta hydrolase [Saccharopolyspora cebuensis]|uniref:Alpha/beta hydrolase n=1 Tax=Saccharopolyspora cebuensis TaxID=418759 RepID=A0ABV4CIP9_9PSEU
MPLHPDAEPIAALLREALPKPGAATLEPEEVRAALRAGAADRPRQEVKRVEDLRIPGPAGNEIPVRIYWPDVPGAALPVVVYFHGGGWVLGDLETHDGAARALANAAAAIVLSVDYRLAPEHRFPAAVEDAYAATQWAAEHAAELDGDPSRLAVAGDSAGGNLAAVVAQLAARDSGPDLAFQLLIYPVTDHDFGTESYLDSADDCVLTAEHMVWFWDHYAPDVADRDDPVASPLRAPDLAGLPPAHVVVAERDPLCSEGLRYAQRLRQAGVPTTVQHCPGLFHGFLGAVDALEPAAAAVDAAHRALADALAERG